MTERPEDHAGRAAAETACRQGQELYQLRQREANEQAVTQFRRAIGLDSRYAPAYAGLAAALCQAMIRYGQPRTLVEEALALARRAVSLDPSLADAHEAVASASFARGDLRGALEAALKVHAINPNFPDATANVAFLYLDLGELVEAVDWSHRALQTEPHSGYIHRNIGRLCLMFGMHELAAPWLGRAVQLAPAFSSARILLIYHLLSQGNVASAHEEVDLMLGHRPNDPETLNYAADVGLMLGNLEQARTYYERAINLGSDSRNFYRARRAKTGMGYLLWIRGERDAARRLFEGRQEPRMREFAEGLNAWGPPYELAAIHAVTGEAAAALDWLRKAAERGWREPHLAETDVLLKPLHARVEFHDFLTDLRRMIGDMRKRVTIPPFPTAGET